MYRNHLVIICVTFTLLVSACSVGDDLPLEPSPAADTFTPTVTETIIWFPATSTPTMPATLEPTPTPDASISYGELLLDDQFTNGANWTEADATAGNRVIGSNELTLAVASPGAVLTSSHKDLVVQDFYLETTITASLCRQQDSFGLIYAAVTPREYHRIAFNCAGQYRLEKVYFSRVTAITDWMGSSQAVRGPGAPVRMRVWSGNGLIRLYLNDQFELSHPVYPPAGGIGFFAASGGDTAVTISFSDLQVYQVTRADYIPTATPTLPPTKTPVPTAPKP